MQPKHWCIKCIESNIILFLNMLNVSFKWTKHILEVNKAKIVWIFGGAKKFMFWKSEQRIWEISTVSPCMYTQGN